MSHFNTSQTNDITLSINQQHRSKLRTQYFSESEYHTDPGQLAGRSFNLFTGGRAYFIIKFLSIILRSRRIALSDKMDANEWARASIDIMRLLERCGAVFHITGFDNIRHLDEPVIFISNHMSTLETMIFPVLIAPFMDVTFVVKESLVSMPLFSPTMRSRDPIVVSRANSREDLVKVISEGTEKLANGTSIVIFPQSTRREYFNPDEFNSLGVKLASRSGKRIVPMAIRTDFWKNGKLIKDLGPFDRSIPVNIKFGELMEVTGNGREEQQKIVAFVLENLKQWGAKVAERVPDHPSS